MVPIADVISDNGSRYDVVIESANSVQDYKNEKQVLGNVLFFHFLIDQPLGLGRGVCPWPALVLSSWNGPRSSWGAYCTN